MDDMKKSVIEIVESIRLGAITSELDRLVKKFEKEESV